MSANHMKCVVLAASAGTWKEQMSDLQSDFQSVVTVQNEVALVENSIRMQPRVILADLSLTRDSSFHWLRRLLSRCPLSRVIVLSDHPAYAVREAAFSAGAAGFVLKIKIASHLLPAVHQVMSGHRYGTLCSEDGR